MAGDPPTSNSFIRSKNCPWMSPHTGRRPKYSKCYGIKELNRISSSASLLVFCFLGQFLKTEGKRDSREQDPVAALWNSLHQRCVSLLSANRLAL